MRHIILGILSAFLLNAPAVAQEQPELSEIRGILHQFGFSERMLRDLETDIQYAFNPLPEEVLNRQRRATDKAWDLWGRGVTQAEAEGLPDLSPANGAVPVNEETLRLGQEAFYRETFGNEPGLVGLYWTAPYLHDGGVAVGPDAETQLGLPGTLNASVRPDPANSLRAMIDRDLRERVVAANHADQDLRDINIEGVGHTHWVDPQAGFSPEDQDALVHYLLTVEGD